jgi:hypothetical protein
LAWWQRVWRVIGSILVRVKRKNIAICFSVSSRRTQCSRVSPKLLNTIWAGNIQINLVVRSMFTTIWSYMKHAMPDLPLCWGEIKHRASLFTMDVCHIVVNIERTTKLIWIFPAQIVLSNFGLKLKTNPFLSVIIFEFSE